MLWEALERLWEEGRTRSIGVSNFGVGHIEELKGFAKVWPPHVNQIEVCHYCPVSQVVLVLIIVAPPLVSTTRDRRILQKARHRG